MPQCNGPKLRRGNCPRPALTSPPDIAALSVGRVSGQKRIERLPRDDHDNDEERSQTTAPRELSTAPALTSSPRRNGVGRSPSSHRWSAEDRLVTTTSNGHTSRLRRVVVHGARVDLAERRGARRGREARGEHL